MIGMIDEVDNCWSFYEWRYFLCIHSILNIAFHGLIFFFEGWWERQIARGQAVSIHGMARSWSTTLLHIVIMFHTKSEGSKPIWSRTSYCSLQVKLDIFFLKTKFRFRIECYSNVRYSVTLYNTVWCFWIVQCGAVYFIIGWYACRIRQSHPTRDFRWPSRDLLFTVNIYYKSAWFFPVPSCVILNMGCCSTSGNELVCKKRK